MRLKSSIWVAAYLRRCQTEGIFGAVRRRGAEEAGAVFVKLALLDGKAILYAPAPQTAYDDSRPIERVFVPASREPVAEQAVDITTRLLSAIASPDETEADEVVLPTELVVRGSTDPARSVA